MVCKKPFNKGIYSFGCGQCLPCRVSKSRLWAHRILLESYLYNNNTFVTLTYSEDDKTVKKINNLLSLDSEHTKNFLKRLRSKFPKNKIRYYLVGEYGEQTQRPHYHADRDWETNY